MALRRKARKKSAPASSTGSKSASTKSAPGRARPDWWPSLSDPRTLRRLLLAAKVVGPVVAAGAMKTSTEVRGVLDDRRARQLGVPIEDVAAYKGPTGTVQARITGLTKAIDELRARRGTDQTVARFTEIAHRPAGRAVRRQPPRRCRCRPSTQAGGAARHLGGP